MAREVNTIQGKLLTAVRNGGEGALWSIARGRGSVAEKAREVIELTTLPFTDVSVYQAIDITCRK